MNLEPITIQPIGIIHTPHKDIKNMPIQPIAAEGVTGYIELREDLVDGLKDIEGFSHLTLFYHFHKIEGYALQVIPFMDSVEHGIFACKSPKRPNAIGLSTVKLIKVEGNIIHIDMVDMLDGTPLLDIKPFFPKYDNRLDAVAGWLEKSNDIPVDKLRSDERFR